MAGVPEEGSDRARRFEQDILVHLGDLYRAALRLTGRRADAEDLVQETCLRGFRSLDQLRHPGAAKVWLFTILRSVFLRHAAREPADRTRVSLDDVDLARIGAGETWPVGDEGPAVSSRMLQFEAREAILRLPPLYREAVVLAHIGGCSYREMARILDVPIGTVMSRLFRGRRLLRTCLGVLPVRSGTRSHAG